MNPGTCTTFRNALAAALTPGAAERGERTAELGWHEHLLGCHACRELLSAEEALDELLATLPEPELPADLTRRVLSRLSRARAAVEPGPPEHALEPLDRLLELDQCLVPAELGASVLTALAGAREEARLDALLGLIEDPLPPAGLAQRTLAALAGERRRRGPRLLPRRKLVLAGALAAALLIVALVLRLRRPDPEGSAPREPLRVAQAEVDNELLEALEVLENWELLMSDDLDVFLAELDPVDWTLLEYGSEEHDLPAGEENGG